MILFKQSHRYDRVVLDSLGRLHLAAVGLDRKPRYFSVAHLPMGGLKGGSILECISPK